MEKIKIGKIVNVVGLKGQVKVFCYTDNKEQFGELGQIWLDQKLYTIDSARLQGNVAVLKLKGVDDRNAAELLRGREVLICESELPKLPEGSYYVRELIGLQVEDEAGQRLGILSDVVQNTGQDLYEVSLETGKKVMIPAVKEFILDIDLNKKVIGVKLPEGLLDL